MNLKTFWRIFTLSFYSPELYIAIASKWKHWGLNFLLKLSILMATIYSISLFLFIYSFNLNEPILKDFLSQIPDLKIENNLAEFVDDSLKSPIRIKLNDNARDLIIVDLAITESNKYSYNGMIFTKDRIDFNFNDASIFSIHYKDLLKIYNIKVLNEESIISLLTEGKKRVLGTLLCLGIPVGSFLCFILTLMKSLFYASVASVVMKIIGGNLNFKQLTRIAIISQTPAIIFTMLSSMLLFRIGLDSVIQSVMGAIYIFYFVSAVLLCNKKLNTK